MVDAEDIAQNLPTIVCECGARILLVPDLDEMMRSIEAHSAEHEKLISDPEKAEAEHCRIEGLLAQKILIAIGQRNHNQHK